jgi:hypothetical protein
MRVGAVSGIEKRRKMGRKLNPAWPFFRSNCTNFELGRVLGYEKRELVRAVGLAVIVR